MEIKKKAKRKTWIIVGIIAVTITAAISLRVFRPSASTYKSVKAWTGDIATYYSFSGNVSSKNRQTLISDKIMQVSKISVKKGDQIEKGDTLIVTTAGEKLVSKINGEVVNIHVGENQQVTPGMQLIDIIDFNSLEVIFKVDEYDVGALKPGMQADVKIGAAGMKVEGKIAEISREGQIVNGVTFYMASIDIAEDDRIRIGMSAEVRLLSNEARNIVILPMDVIQFDDRNLPYVLKNGEKNETVQKRITTGINDGTYVEVKSGIASGEEILYKDNTGLGNLFFPEGGKKARAQFGGADD